MRSAGLTFLSGKLRTNGTISSAALEMAGAENNNNKSIPAAALFLTKGAADDSLQDVAATIDLGNKP